MATKQSSRLKTKRRPGEPWISKNRVLNPTKSKRKPQQIYRNPNFDTDETKLLIQLWGDPKVQRELITTHKKHVVIAQLASKMEEYGYYRSPEEITTRIKNMKCFYNRIKKEMELNRNLDPSWRHYADMDAIMMRPIFSVRPNEVPAPSLKYLMEQEEEKRMERKRIAKEDGIDVSDSDYDIEDVLAVPLSNSKRRIPSDCIEPDADIELDVDDEMLAAIEKCGDVDKQTKEDTNNDKNRTEMKDAMSIKMEIESEEFQTVEDNVQLSKSKESLNKDFDAELIIPKEEPIDVDNESQSADESNVSKTQTNVTPNLVNMLNQTKTSQAVTRTITIAKYSMPQNSMATTTTTSCTNSSKISVVSPTILMPPTSQSTIDTSNSPRQVRIGGNLQAILTSGGAQRQTVTAANGMKFILVNAGDQRGPPLTTATLPMMTTKQNAQQTVKIVQQPQNLQQQQHQATRPQQTTTTSSSLPKSSSYNLSTKKRVADQLPDRDTLRRRELTGIKSTLQRLLKTKEDSNELQSQRLAIERERLQFERTTAEKFLSIFEQNQKNQLQMLQQILQQQQQQQMHHPVAQRPGGQQIFTTNNPASNTMPNSGQLVMPQQLFLTTMVPNSTATGSVNATKVLTAANFKNLTSSVNNFEQPSIIPKEEPIN